MPDLRVVSAEELKPVLDVLTNLTWPIPYSDVPQIIEKLGWTRFGETGATSGFGVSLTAVPITRIGDEVSGLDMRVSDSFPAPTTRTESSLRRAYPALVDAVEVSCFL